MEEYVNITDIIGKTITKVIGSTGDSSLTFHTECGMSYTMYHEQDCCESVWLEDVYGDLQELVGRVINFAEETSQENPYASESGTWTFYKLSTTYPYVNIVLRWNGESNGYYSEHVSIVKGKI